MDLGLVSEVAGHADELCLIRSMQCDQPVHPGAMTQMHTGTAQFIRPSLGAWTLYGLGTENDSLPGSCFVESPAGVHATSGVPSCRQSMGERRWDAAVDSRHAVLKVAAAIPSPISRIPVSRQNSNATNLI